MKFSLKPIHPEKIEADALVVFLFEDELQNFPITNGELKNLIQSAIKREDFHAFEEEILSLSTKGCIPAYKLLIIGLGKKDEFNIFRLYSSVSLAVKKIKEIKLVKIALSLPEYWLSKIDTFIAVKSTVEAVSLSSYRFVKYKSLLDKNKTRQIEEVVLPLPAGKMAVAEQALKIGSIFSQATLFARDLINEPSAVTTPSYLASVAQRLAKSSLGLTKVKIMGKEEVKKLGMEAFMAVGKGSDEEIKFIHLRYKGPYPKKKIVIIGKGITFDAGGLSLKSAKGMETMKLDMSGAAAVLGIFQALPLLKPAVEVVGLIPACENMPSGKSLKPGDILTAMNKKTIEVVNTDAEGRLTLADALSFAQIKEKPNEIIDLATLTGACMVALGEEIAGLWGNNEKLLSQLEDSAKSVGEKIWRMPLEKNYKKLIKSHIADIKNVQDGRYGGAITASLFLSEFVKDASWAHLDIAGPAYAEKDVNPLTPLGGVGFGVRLILHYLTSL